MLSVREPLLNPMPIEELRPTQITVGMREVEEKRLHWRSLHTKDKKAFLAKHMIPVVHGPKEHFYITRIHHHPRACLAFRGRSRGGLLRILVAGPERSRSRCFLDLL